MGRGGAGRGGGSFRDLEMLFLEQNTISCIPRQTTLVDYVPLWPGRILEHVTGHTSLSTFLITSSRHMMCRKVFFCAIALIPLPPPLFFFFSFSFLSPLCVCVCVCV